MKKLSIVLSMLCAPSLSQAQEFTKHDMGGESIYAISADGNVLGGTMPVAGIGRAVRWVQGIGSNDLGTLKSDNSGGAAINGLSADGSVAVGYAASDYGTNIARAFRWTSASGMTDLGTLKSDNSGGSLANAVSADGNVVVGNAVNDNNDSHAFRWTAGSGMTDLGTLRSNNSGQSLGRAISADGSVVGGSAANDNNENRAFRWTTASGMTDLGTLKSDNSGNSSAIGMSADGSIMVGGASSDNGFHAFRWIAGSGMTDLGTLTSNNSGYSSASAVSGDGSVVVGYAENDNGDTRAFRWISSEGMTDLGTLKSDNSGNSYAFALSRDGSVIGGQSETDNGDIHSVLWKIKQQVTIVDVNNSLLAMRQTADKAHRVLGFYQGALSGLSDTRCQIGTENYCLGAFTHYDRSSDNSMMTTGLFGALRLLPNEKLTAGASVNMSGPNNLVSGYDTRGSNQPGLGIFTRWDDNPDGTGLHLDMSGAFIQQDLTIRREQLNHTEAGKGNATIKGWQAKGTISWGFKVDENTLIAPVAGLTWQDTSRSAYKETQDADFAASYGKMSDKTTSLRTGVEVTHKAGSNVLLSASAGADTVLSRQDTGFTSSIEYMGEYSYKGKNQDVKPYVQAGVNVEVSKNSVVRVNAGWQETDHHTDNLQTTLSYSYRW